MKILATLIIITALFFSTKAQTNIAYNNCELKPIAIGEKVPEQIWNKALPIVNSPTMHSHIKLSDYGNKLIILDLWATNCHPCIESLALLDSLNRVFKDEIVVIPVLMHDRIERADPFMKKKGYKWPCVVGDTTIGTHMMKDYSFIWGCIWIKDGKLLGAPLKKYLTAENIRKALKGEAVGFMNRTPNRQKMEKQ
uniref:TlpA family protein disulfide reductase n=1 Tax=Pedobacter schmidteae TaxID=2201271 RepID=UPI000EAC1BAF|nr:redoxin domain-containing protein [Pedobacter schmidteae]